MDKDKIKVLMQLEDSLVDIKNTLSTISLFAKEFHKIAASFDMGELESNISQLRKAESIVDYLTEMSPKLDSLFDGDDSKRLKAFRKEQQALLDEAVDNTTAIRNTLRKLTKNQMPDTMVKYKALLAKLLKKNVDKGVKITQSVLFDMTEKRMHFSLYFKLLLTDGKTKRRIFVVACQDVFKGNGKAGPLGLCVFNRALPPMPYDKPYAGATNSELTSKFICNMIYAYGAQSMLSTAGRAKIPKKKPSASAKTTLEESGLYASIEVNKIGNVVRFVIPKDEMLAIDPHTKERINQYSKSRIDRAIKDAALLVLAKSRKWQQLPRELQNTNVPGIGAAVAITCRFVPKVFLDHM